MFVPTIFTLVFLDALSFSMTIITFGPYIYSLGGTQLYLGILGSFGSLTTVIWNPLAGSLSDSLGRKAVMIRCLAICLVGQILMVVSSSLTVIFISRILASFGVPIMALTKAMIDDNVASKDKKMDVINKMMAITAVSFMIGSLAGGFISEYENGVKYIFAFVSVAFLINIILISTIKDKTSKTTPKDGVDNKLNIIESLKNIKWDKLWDIFALKLICDFAMNVLFFNSGHILTVKFGIAGKSLGLFFFFKSLIMIAINLSMSKLKSTLYKDDESCLKRLLHSVLLISIASIGSCMTFSLPLYILLTIPVSIVQSLLESTVTEAVLTRVSESEKGTTMGAFDNTFFMAGLVGPPLSGFLTDKLGDTASTLICCFAPTLLGVFLVHKQKTKITKSKKQ